MTYYPFFSQQDKRSGKFLLESDSGVKLYAYMARHSPWDVRFVLPPEEQCEGGVDVGCDVLRSPPLAPDNLDRRLQWDPPWLRRVADCDLVLTQHEFLPIPLGALGRARVALEVGIRPTTAWPETAGLFPLAWAAADLVHCNSATLARELRGRGVAARVWEFGYDDAVAVPRHVHRDVDVLFNSRCSATGYTHHGAVLAALSSLPLRCVATDPTSYVRSRGGHACVPATPLTRDEYVDLLHRSKVVVGTADNGYGGYAFQEAVAAGCLPVALRRSEYEDLLGSGWPYLCELSELRRCIASACERMWSGVDASRLSARIARCSYSEAWTVARGDLEALCS